MTENTVVGEFKKNGFENALVHEKGTLVLTHMWNYNDGAADFRIMAQDMPQNSDDAAAFGKVTSGMDTVDEIASIPTFYDQPFFPQVMKKVTVK